jgi:uncharacterized protein (TIGR02996 family)
MSKSFTQWLLLSEVLSPKERQEFHAAIDKNPHDDSHWLVYADRLEETGNPDMAEYIRRYVAKTKDDYGSIALHRNVRDHRLNLPFHIHPRQYEEIVRLRLALESPDRFKHLSPISADDLKTSYISIGSTTYHHAEQMSHHVLIHLVKDKDSDLIGKTLQVSIDDLRENRIIDNTTLQEMFIRQELPPSATTPTVEILIREVKQRKYYDAERFLEKGKLPGDYKTSFYVSPIPFSIDPNKGYSEIFIPAKELSI